ncbi:hypothetical protein [Falsiroseomonas selenitidurans]|uniref:Uncharacterized protein n=1 Tax=Falsiroseomonas selenitidurans TaxID=2716335 RepID=A0ABX1DZ50_9PROT|nr:hypothetical protein [Falsiroseomonas selenitidurans]NKC30179.1 hypothetical protein [Falsiroseomonas selenitidurans]
MADQALPALVKRSAELLGDLEKAQGLVQHLHGDLASLDAVIRQFDPEYPVGNIRPRYRRAQTPAETGSHSWAVLDALRVAGEQLLAAELAKRVIAERGLDASDKGLRSLMAKRVRMALRYQRTNGMAREMTAATGGIN